MIIKHVRKNICNTPYATFVAYKTDNGDILFGYSKYAKKLEDLSFSKKDGIKIAIENSNKDIVLFQNEKRCLICRKNNLTEGQFLLIPLTIEKAAIFFLRRTVKYFGTVPSNVMIYFDETETETEPKSAEHYKERTDDFLEIIEDLK